MENSWGDDRGNKGKVSQSVVSKPRTLLCIIYSEDIFISRWANLIFKRITSQSSLPFLFL